MNTIYFKSFIYTDKFQASYRYLNGHVIRIILLVAIILSQAGCISLEKRIDTETIDKAATSALDGCFSSKPSYYTENAKSKKNPADEGIHFLLAFWNLTDKNLKFDTIQFNLTNPEHLYFKLLKDGQSVHQQNYRLAEDFKFDSDGRIHLNKDTCAGAPMALPLGICSFDTLTLSLNNTGDLVITMTKNGGGFVILPVWVYAQKMWIFPRIH